MYYIVSQGGWRDNLELLYAFIILLVWDLGMMDNYLRLFVAISLCFEYSFSVVLKNKKQYFETVPFTDIILSDQS